MISRKMYKYTAIISFAIMVMLIGNLIIPVITTAEETKKNGFLSAIQYNEENNTLSVNGTVPEGFVNYKLYWSAGDMPVEQLPENATDEQKDKKIDNAIEWSIQGGRLLADVITSDSKNISSTIDIPSDRTKDITYNALCIVTAEDGSRMMHVVKKTLGANKTIENTIEINLNVEGNKIDINVKDEEYDIKVIKFAKSEGIVSVKDFENVNEVLEFKQGKNVTVSKEVSSPGIYYVYAETTAGTKSVNACIVAEKANKEEPEEELAVEEEPQENKNQENKKEKETVKEVEKTEQQVQESQKQVEQSVETKTPEVEKKEEKAPEENTTSQKKEEQPKEVEENNDNQVIEVKIDQKNEEKIVVEDGYVVLDDKNNSEKKESKESNDKTKKETTQNNEVKKESNNKNEKNIEKQNDVEINTNKEDVTTVQKADKIIPQTGSDNTAVVVAIFVFAGISIVSYLKYKKAEE